MQILPFVCLTCVWRGAVPSQPLRSPNGAQRPNDIGYWHKADMTAAFVNFRLQDKSGHLPPEMSNPNVMASVRAKK
jgi:hypothetical protein